VKRNQFARTLEKLNHKQLEAFEDFLDSYLPLDILDPEYSEKLFNKFYQLPEELQWAAFMTFLKDREKIKYEFDFNMIVDNFK
jgi:hypothetical protein